MFRHILIIFLFLQGVLVSAVLDNIEIKGVKVPVIFEKDTHLPIATLQLVIRKSGSIEDSGHAGLARFTASMLNEGSKKLGSVKFASELEQRAISLSAHGGTETFVFELSSLKEQFPYGISMLKQLLNDPNFTKESFEKVKSQTLGELSSKKSDFDYIANVNLKKLIYKGTPIEHPFSGDEKSIKNLKLDEVKNFYNTHIDLSNLIIVIGGDIGKSEFVKIITPLLNDIKVGKRRELKEYKVSGDEKEKIVKKDTDQAYIYFGAPLYVKSGDENIYKSKVASFILGESGFGSRLMEEVRVKKGLAYSIYSRDNISKSYSSFTGYLQTKTDNLGEAKKLVKKVIDGFVKNGSTADELEQAKKFLLGSEPLRSETLSQRLSRAFFEYYSGYKLGHSKKVLANIEKLSLKDLNDFIKKHKEITKLSFSIVTK
ncbi:MAG: insulinase family protein [Epsilonproteobacteria bacterium]|nr:insulinase family protein [Campylobacterota bacterium]